MLPTSLTGRMPEPRSIPQVDRATVASQLARGNLSEVLGEVAGDWLGGSCEERIAVAQAVLEHLDRHPLHRSNTLGAFVAGLCQSPGAA